MAEDEGKKEEEKFEFTPEGKVLGGTVDNGGWVAEHDCDYAPDFIPAEGGGMVFLQNRDVNDARYRYFSIREIAPV